MFLITKCESQLTSCRVCPYAIAALDLAHAIRVVRCAPNSAMSRDRETHWSA
jgi:hypothetical protein